MNDRLRKGYALSKPAMKSYLPRLLFLGAVAIFLAYVVKHADEYRNLINVSWKALLGLVGLATIEVALLGLVNTLLYRGLGVPLDLSEGVGMAAVNSLANQLPFSGGIVSKAVYLKHRHGLSYSLFLGATLALYVCFVAASGALGLSTLVLGTILGAFQFKPLLFAAFIGMASSVVLFIVPIARLPFSWSGNTLLLGAARGWEFLSQRRLLAVQLVTLQTIATMFIGVRFWLAFRMLSQEVSLLHTVLFASSAVLALLVTIAPGGLGVREGIVAATSAVLGFAPTVSVLAVGIDRLTSTLVVITLGTIFTYVLGRSAVQSRESVE